MRDGADGATDLPLVRVLVLHQQAGAQQVEAVQERLRLDRILFFNERYTFHGVVVSILSGQGTIVAVSNG